MKQKQTLYEGAMASLSLYIYIKQLNWIYLNKGS